MLFALASVSASTSSSFVLFIRIVSSFLFRLYFSYLKGLKSCQLSCTKKLFLNYFQHIQVLEFQLGFFLSICSKNNLRFKYNDLKLRIKHFGYSSPDIVLMAVFGHSRQLSPHGTFCHHTLLNITSNPSSSAQNLAIQQIYRN